MAKMDKIDKVIEEVLRSHYFDRVTPAIVGAVSATIRDGGLRINSNLEKEIFHWFPTRDAGKIAQQIIRKL